MKKMSKSNPIIFMTMKSLSYLEWHSDWNPIGFISPLILPSVIVKRIRYGNHGVIRVQAPFLLRRGNLVIIVLKYFIYESYKHILSK